MPSEPPFADLAIRLTLQAPPGAAPAAASAASPAPAAGPARGVRLIHAAAPGRRWTCTVELLYRAPASDADTDLLHGQPAVVEIDEAALLASPSDADYGERLGSQLFTDPVLTAYLRARDMAHAQRPDAVPLRLRLWLMPGAEALHALHWEKIRVPGEESALATDEMVLFSRYLSSPDTRSVSTPPLQGLRALVLVANPADLDRWGLAPIDVAAELAMARAHLKDISIAELAGPGQATLDRLLAGLRAGCDILYLGCHGVMEGGDTLLCLEDAQGNTDFVSGAELAERLRQAVRRPQLVVLASCQTAGIGSPTRGAGGVLAAVGPQLVTAAGIPAVVAMQGNVLDATVARFMPIFFAELRRDGLVDRALAAARSPPGASPTGGRPRSSCGWSRRLWQFLGKGLYPGNAESAAVSS